MTYGEPIMVDGVKPDWLRDEMISVAHVGLRRVWTGGIASHVWREASWSSIHSIRLDVDHPYYRAVAAGFTYWPGGDVAPDDWDGDEVLLDNGAIGDVAITWDWRRTMGIIGYRRRAMDVVPPCNISPALVERMVTLVRDVAADRIDRATKRREARAIVADLPPEPVDPLLLRAREICAVECGEDHCIAGLYRSGVRDNTLSVRCVLAALRRH